MQLAEGSIKMTGDQKYTFDLICEQYCNSYRLENIPAYRTAGYALRKEPFVPIVPAYLTWREAFLIENNLGKPKPKEQGPGVVFKQTKFSVDEEEKSSDDEEKGPATKENKKKGVLKKNATAGAGKKGRCRKERENTPS